MEISKYERMAKVLRDEFSLEIISFEDLHDDDFFTMKVKELYDG